MRTHKPFLYLNNLLTKSLLLIFFALTTNACLNYDNDSAKQDIVQITLDGEKDTTLVDFGITQIGETQTTKKTFKLSNLSTQNVIVEFSIPEGYKRVTSNTNQGVECNDRASMYVEGNEVCYFGIEFKPTVRLTHEDNAPLSIVVDMNGEEYNYNNLFTLQGIATNSESITFLDKINFGSTARNSSKINSTALHNTTNQSIFYNIVVLDNITIDENSTCKQSGLLNDQSSCDILFRYSAGTTTGNIKELITVEQDLGNKIIEASMDVKNSAIVNIVAPTPRSDASMITSGDSSSNGKLKLIGGRNTTNTANNIWTFDISKEIWTLDNNAFTGTPNIAQLYNNRVATVGSKTLVLPNPVTTDNSFDDRTFILNVDNTLTDASNTSNARNNYKIATNTTNKNVYIYGGITQGNSLSNNVSLVKTDSNFEDINTSDNPDRHLAAFASVDDTFYLFGGSTQDNITNMSNSLFKYQR